MPTHLIGTQPAECLIYGQISLEAALVLAALGLLTLFFVGHSALKAQRRNYYNLCLYFSLMVTLVGGVLLIARSTGALTEIGVFSGASGQALNVFLKFLLETEWPLDALQILSAYIIITFILVFLTGGLTGSLPRSSDKKVSPGHYASIISEQAFWWGSLFLAKAVTSAGAAMLAVGFYAIRFGVCASPRVPVFAGCLAYALLALGMGIGCMRMALYVRSILNGNSFIDDELFQALFRLRRLHYEIRQIAIRIRRRTGVRRPSR